MCNTHVCTHITLHSRKVVWRHHQCSSLVSLRYDTYAHISVYGYWQRLITAARMCLCLIKRKNISEKSVSCSFFSFPCSSLIFFFVLFLSTFFYISIIRSLHVFFILKINQIPFFPHIFSQTNILPKECPHIFFLSLNLTLQLLLLLHILTLFTDLLPVFLYFILYFFFRMTNNTLRNKQYDFYNSDIA